MRTEATPGNVRLNDGLGPNAKTPRAPCGECHLQQGERCDVCGAVAPRLERWGRGPEGTPHLLQRLPDGYWTPWHLAEAAVAELRALADSEGTRAVWVPVEERLPPEGVRVLVYVPTCELLPIQADEWNEQREDPTGMGGPTIATGHMWDEHEFEEVTHWMFLPTPPVLPGPDLGPNVEANRLP